MPFGIGLNVWSNVVISIALVLVAATDIRRQQTVDHL